MFRTEHTLRGGAVVARQAHNLKAVGSIPAPATNNYSASHLTGFFCAVNVPEYEGFVKILNSLSPPKTEKIAQNPLFFSVLRGTRRSTPSLLHSP